MSDDAEDIEFAMLKEDYDALPLEAHGSRLHWGDESNDYKPSLAAGRRTIPTMQDRT